LGGLCLHTYLSLGVIAATAVVVLMLQQCPAGQGVRSCGPSVVDS